MKCALVCLVFLFLCIFVYVEKFQDLCFMYRTLSQGHFHFLGPTISKLGTADGCFLYSVLPGANTKPLFLLLFVFPVYL